MKPCIKHNYQLVNNRYNKKGRPDLRGEWRTKRKCLECGMLFPQVEVDRIKSKLKVIN